MSQADIEKALRRGSNFENSKLRIWEIYQTQPDRKLRTKALAKEYAPHGPGGCSHTYLDGSSGWLDHDSKGLTFEHYPDHQKIFLRWNQVEKYIDLMMQADRYLTDKEKSAIELYFGLNADSAAEYNALKEQYPDALVPDDHGMLPSVSAKLIRRKVCEKNSVFCCVLAVEMLQDGKPTLIYAIVCKKPEENFAKENFMGHYFC